MKNWFHLFLIESMMQHPSSIVHHNALLPLTFVDVAASYLEEALLAELPANENACQDPGSNSMSTGDSNAA